jgi:DNA polymerase III sliding clamp (beta) subunit (PCNA family)
MKIKTQRALLAQIVKTVSPALVKGDTPAEAGQYVILKVDEKELSVIVACDALTAKATIGSSMLEGEMLEITSGGKYAVNGSMLLHDLSTSAVNDSIVIDFKEQKATAKAKKQEEDELGEDADKAAVEPESVGTLFIKYPGPKGETDTTRLQCIDLPVDPKIEVDTSSRLTIKGSDFIQYVRQVGIAIGKANMNEDYSNVLIKTTGNMVEMVGTNGIQLSLAVFESVDSSKDLRMVLPYEKVAAIAKMIQPDRSVTIYLTEGQTRDAVFLQDVTYGEKVVGRAMFKIREKTDRFVQYEALIKSLSFISSCKVKRQQLKAACERLEGVTLAKTAMSFDPTKELIAFSKDEGSGGITTHVSIESAQGQKLDMNVSSRHLRVAADATTEEDIELKLSGAKSLGLMVLSPTFSMYFMPFNLAE